jgi:hypothetical protein
VVGDDGRGQGHAERFDALAAAGVAGHDATAEELLEDQGFDDEAAAAGHVHHVERDDGGQAAAEGFAHEQQRAGRLEASMTTQTASGAATGPPGTAMVPASTRRQISASLMSSSRE